MQIHSILSCHKINVFSLFFSSIGQDQTNLENEKITPVFINLKLNNKTNYRRKNTPEFSRLMHAKASLISAGCSHYLLY